MIVRDIESVKTVEWGNGLSRRFLLAEDGLGYSLTDTTVLAGTKSRLEYVNHLEACYCIEGSGEVIELDGTSHEIVPGRMYALDQHDAHYLVASPTRTCAWSASSHPPCAATRSTASTPTAPPPTEAPDAAPILTITESKGSLVIRWNADQAELRDGLERWGDALSADHIELDEQSAFSEDKWKLVQKTGILSLPFDEDHGGLGQSLLTTMYVLEGLGEYNRDAGLSFCITTSICSTGIPLQHFGTPEQKDRYLHRICSGEAIGAHAITEAKAAPTPWPWPPGPYATATTSSSTAARSSSATAPSPT